MSDASERLAQTRRAIIEQVERRERKHDPRERRAERQRERAEARAKRGDDDSPRDIRGWFDTARHALTSWWRHHPAHMGLEIATPVLSAYAERKPLQYLGIAAAVGAVVMVTRPWRLLSITGVVMALVKSSQLSGVLMSALSAADFRKDNDEP
jgi:Flp pilus assembly protein TadB